MKTVWLSERLWKIAGIWISVLAVVVTAVALARLPAQKMRFQQKQAQLERLYQLAESGNRGRLARRAFEALAPMDAVSLDGLIQAFAGTAEADIRDSEHDNLDAGWLRRRAIIKFSEIKYEDLWMLLRQAESQRPPWRLAGIEIAASASAADKAGVILTLEVLSKPAE